MTCQLNTDLHNHKIQPIVSWLRQLHPSLVCTIILFSCLWVWQDCSLSWYSYALFQGCCNRLNLRERNEDLSALVYVQPCWERSSTLPHKPGGEESHRCSSSPQSFVLPLYLSKNKSTCENRFLYVLNCGKQLSWKCGDWHKKSERKKFIGIKKITAQIL